MRCAKARTRLLAAQACDGFVPARSGAANTVIFCTGNSVQAALAAAYLPYLIFLDASDAGSLGSRVTHAVSNAN